MNAETMKAENLIPDPADRLTPDLLTALERRYANTVDHVVLADDAQRYSNLCDLVCQLLWPEKYGTDPQDPLMHTSAPARSIAMAIMTAAGLTPRDANERG
ncbi:hypothetical protein ACFXJ8_32530 [Nonomuraea sp. NPDC059194]|uniref:hypothetical protein n=1 Tax=Nonomuraea sp. NPDC059194 TaxID=3346764 RepID=UPI0036ACC900